MPTPKTGKNFLYYHVFNNNTLSIVFRSTQPLQKLINRGTELLAIGLAQFRRFSGIQRALAEQEKCRFYTYWCKAETYLSTTREEMRKHKILLDVISRATEQIIDRTELEPLECL